VGFLSWVALILLTLTGYSAGAVLGLWTRAHERVRTTDPSLWDLAVVILLWIGVGLARGLALGRWWAVLLGLGAGLVAGFVLSLIQPRRTEHKSLTL
jgi:membrane associated rhomboid family serine protease